MYEKSPPTHSSEEIADLVREVRELRDLLEKPQARLLRRSEACIYLGVGEAWFDEHVRPHIPEIGSKGAILFAREHLDDWINLRIADSIHNKNLLGTAR